MHLHAAHDLAALVRRGAVSAVDIADSFLTRITESSLNAFTDVDADGVRRRAQTIDEAIAGGGDPGPLAGVPVALKDLIDREGEVNTAGSSFYRRQADRNATVVTRLETAGAVIIGRTGLHEFAFGFSSENPWFGAVRNPWDPSTSPGGSSGGSAAAVAAGLASVGIGTDTGGSVRVPAALCGVVGLKVTHGRIPLTGVFPLAPSLDTVGPIARSIADAAFCYEIMAGHDPADPWSHPGPTDPIQPISLAGLRLRIPQPWVGDGPTNATVRAALAWLADRLTDAGAEVEEARVPAIGFHSLLTPSAYGEAAAVHRSFRSDPRNRYGPDVDARLVEAERVTLDDYLEALAWRAGLRQAFAVLFDRADMVVTPATGACRKMIGRDEIDLDGTPHPYRPVLSWFTAPVNHAGLPALTAPLAVPGAPPPAVQLIAPWWHEGRLLGVARALEEGGMIATPAPPGH
jgi:Asp-tRNA(Asn)/Glu-tRNA(Gln) amidotransferase A subunit family amidase